MKKVRVLKSVLSIVTFKASKERYKYLVEDMTHTMTIFLLSDRFVYYHPQKVLKHIMFVYTYFQIQYSFNIGTLNIKKKCRKEKYYFNQNTTKIKIQDTCINILAIIKCCLRTSMHIWEY